MAASYSHPRLGLQSYGGDTDDDGSSSSGELRRGLIPARRPPRGRAVGAPTATSPWPAAISPCIKPRRSTVSIGGAADDDEEQVDDTDGLGRSDGTAMAPRYVSFEDLIGTETFTFWNGVGQQQPPPERGGITSDPLVRATSRPYGREVATVKPPRKRGRSPGPLGTRRGSAMHGLVKKYVHPFFGFVAGIFCCAIPS